MRPQVMSFERLKFQMEGIAEQVVRNVVATDTDANAATSIASVASDDDTHRWLKEVHQRYHQQQQRHESTTLLGGLSANHKLQNSDEHKTIRSLTFSTPEASSIVESTATATTTMTTTKTTMIDRSEDISGEHWTMKQKQKQHHLQFNASLGTDITTTAAAAAADSAEVTTLPDIKRRKSIYQRIVEEQQYKQYKKSNKHNHHRKRDTKKRIIKRISSSSSLISTSTLWWRRINLESALNKKKLLLFGQLNFLMMAILIIMLIGVSEAVDCFKCSSRNGSNPACEDPFHNLNTTRVTSPVLPDPQPNVIYHTPCYAGKKGKEGLFPASACIKLTGTFDATGETLVVRHCALDSGTLTQDTELARMSHCGKFQFEGDLLRGCVMACPNDACNSAPKLMANPPSSSSSFILDWMSISSVVSTSLIWFILST